MNILKHKTFFQVLFCTVILSIFSTHALADTQQKHSEVPNVESSGQVNADTPHDVSHDASTTHADTGSGHGSGHANIGEHLPLWSCIPFACILLSIALFPIVLPDFWHHHFAKLSGFWAATLAIPFLIAIKGAALYEILHIILADYVPFIILLWSLYTLSGGILLRGTLRGTPLVNVAMLIIGTLLASWMGTTGAVMFMIRLFLRANNYRKNRTFMVRSICEEAGKPMPNFFGYILK